MRSHSLFTVILLTIANFSSGGCATNPSSAEQLLPSNPVVVKAESRWHDSPGDAEAEAQQRMDRELRRAESTIRNAGGRVERILHETTRMTERKNGDSTEWKAEMRARVTWSTDSNLISSEEVGIVPVSVKVMDHLLNVLGDTPGTRPFSMRIDNLTAVGGEITIDESKLIKFPDRIREEVFVFDNLLGSQEIKRNQTFSVTTETGRTVTVETSLEQTKQIDATLDFPYIKIGALGSERFTLTKTDEQNFRKTEVLSEELNFTIPPRKKVTITLRMVESTARYPFAGAVIFDGTWYYNDRLPRTLSSTVSETRRRVGVNGVIDDAKVREFKLTVVEADQ